MEKKLKRIIIYLLISILIILFMIFILTRNSDDSENNNSPNKNSFIPDTPQESLYKNIFEKISDTTNYATVNSIIEKYFLTIKNINGDSLENAREEMSIEEIRQKSINEIKDMLDINYKKEFNLDDKVILSKANKFKMMENSLISEKYIILIEDIQIAQLSYTKLLFFITININNNSENMLIKLDLTNRTFSIFLDDYIKKYNYNINMSENEINITDEEIAKNDNNTFKYVSISDETMAREYLKRLKNLFKLDNIKVYNLLDEEYKNKKFATEEAYKNYINQISKQIDNFVLNKYNVRRENTESTEYSIVDN